MHTRRPLLYIFILSLLAPTWAQALTLQQIRGGMYPDKIRLVLELDALADFKVEAAMNPPRLVVDLPRHTLDNAVPPNLSKYAITELRQEGDKRLTFMLRAPAKILSSFMLPRDGDKPDRLVIDYRLLKPNETSGILGVINRAQTPAPTITDDDPAPTPKRTGPYVVVIDAGHGGKDPGAIGVDGVREKNVTLAAARELARQLANNKRYKVVMTRSTDTFILLPERVKIARRNKGDLFISLHADMAEGASDTGGLSIYTLSDTASDAQTEKLAMAENKVDLLSGLDLSHEQKDVANILIDLAMRENMNQSRFLAGKVVKQMGQTSIDLLERPHRYAGFAVLKAPDIPSVLVEMGFLSNRTEARRLQDEAHRRRLMSGLVRGIDAYFDYLDQNRDN